MYRIITHIGDNVESQEVFCSGHEIKSESHPKSQEIKNITVETKRKNVQRPKKSETTK